MRSRSKSFYTLTEIHGSSYSVGATVVEVKGVKCYSEKLQKLKGDRWIKHEGWGWGDMRTEAERQRDRNVKRQRTEGHCQHMAQRSSWLLCNAWLFSWKWWQPMNMHHSAHGPQPSYFRGQAVTRRAWHMWPHLHNLNDTPQQKNSAHGGWNNFAKVRWRKTGNQKTSWRCLFAGQSL